MIKPAAATYYHEGYHWHQRCSGHEPHYILTAQTHIDKVLAYVPAGRRVAVQAGGHCGLWAGHLAKHFDSVYTFEPDMDNFRCLMMNACLWNVYPYRAFLGDEHMTRMLLIGPESGRGQAGLSILHTDPPQQVATDICWGIPTLLVDDLKLDYLDLLCLDVEGYETPALIGATLTIDRCSPIIMTEQTGKVSADGRDFNATTTRRLLEHYGYKQVDQIDKDVIWARS